MGTYIIATPSFPGPGLRVIQNFQQARQVLRQLRMLRQRQRRLLRWRRKLLRRPPSRPRPRPRKTGLNPGPGYPIQNLQTIFCGLQVLLLRRLPQPASPLSLNPTVLICRHDRNYQRNEQEDEPHHIVAMAVFHGHQRFPFLFHKGEIVPIGKTIVKAFPVPFPSPLPERRIPAGSRNPS